MEWQPIETAPKDGTQILAYCIEPDKRCTCIRWDRGAWIMGKSMRGNDLICASKITHWLPLPTLPPVNTLALA